MSTSTRPASSRSRPRGTAGSRNASRRSEPILRCAGVRRAFSAIAASIRRTATSGNSPPATRGRPASRAWYATCPPGPAEASGSTNTASSGPVTTAWRPADVHSIRAERSPERLRPRNPRTAGTRSGGNAACSRRKRTIEPSGMGSGNTARDPSTPGVPARISSSRVVSSSAAKRTPVDVEFRRYRTARCGSPDSADRLLGQPRGRCAGFPRLVIDSTGRNESCGNGHIGEPKAGHATAPPRNLGVPCATMPAHASRIDHTSPFAGSLADHASAVRWQSWQKGLPRSTGGLDREMRTSHHRPASTHSEDFERLPRQRFRSSGMPLDIGSTCLSTATQLPAEEGIASHACMRRRR